MAAFDPLVPLIVTIVGVRCACGRLTTVSVLALAPGNERRSPTAGSAPTLDELEAATAAIEQAAIQASCETRRLVGQQAAAFTAAALPLCRIV